jgi:hypothetical protein
VDDDVLGGDHVILGSFKGDVLILHDREKHIDLVAVAANDQQMPRSFGVADRIDAVTGRPERVIQSVYVVGEEICVRGQSRSCPISQSGQRSNEGPPAATGGKDFSG